ncbi:MAG: helix-turn-helix transcriptional regulator [Bacteroidetes bacterium]|nr:helix-turn-helix transcriptional regulator [Bacteroidota bacterium]
MEKDSYPKMYLYKRIVQAKMFIDEHFAEAIDVNDIADEAYFSKFHFIRLFKKTYGKTPHQYLTSVRIEEAKQLLKNEMTVTEVCYAVGFDSVSSFTGLFKREAGNTPSEYKSQQIALKMQIKKKPLNFIPGCFAGKFVEHKKSNFQEARS